MEEPKIEFFEEGIIQKDPEFDQEILAKKRKSSAVLAVIGLIMTALSSLIYFIFRFNGVNSGKGADYFDLPRVIYLCIFVPFLIVSFFAGVSWVSKIEEDKIKKIILIILGAISGIAMAIWFYIYFSGLNLQSSDYIFPVLFVVLAFFLFFFIFWVFSGERINKELKLASIWPIFIWAVFISTIYKVAIETLMEGALILLLILIILTAVLFIRYIVLFFKNRKNLDIVDTIIFIIYASIALCVTFLIIT